LSTSIANFLILVLTALTAELETAKKALSEEKIARLAANQSLAEEKGRSAIRRSVSLGFR
jgi:hypothetical protein